MAELKALWQRAEEALGKAELRRLFRAWVNGVIRKARIRESNKDASALEREDCERIIADLNRRSGCRYQVTDGAALEVYEMPARLRQMREAMSVVRLLEGRVDWAEKEYQEIKERMRVQS